MFKLKTRLAALTQTTVFIKNSNTGECLNYHSECSDNYKFGPINNFLPRANAIFTGWNDIDLEIKIIKLMLVNNGYPMTIIDQTVNNFISQKCPIRFSKTITIEQQQQLQVVLQITNKKQYKLDDNALQYRVSNKAHPQTPNSRVTLNIFYKNMKVSNLTMKNNITASHDTLQRYIQFIKSNALWRTVPLPTLTTLDTRRVHWRNVSYFMHKKVS